MASRFFTVTVPTARDQDATPLSWPVKDPDVERNYYLYVGPMLASDGATLTSVTSYGQDGLRVGTASLDGDYVVLRIGGGVVNTTYEIGFNIVLNSGTAATFVTVELPVARQILAGTPLIPAPFGTFITVGGTFVTVGGAKIMV